MQINLHQRRLIAGVIALLVVLVALAAFNLNQPVAHAQATSTPTPTVLAAARFPAAQLDGPILFNEINEGKIVSGRTSFAVRDPLDSNNNLLVSSAGNVTVRNNLTVSGSSVTLPTGSIGISAMADISRTVHLPLGAFYECTTNAGAALAFTDGTDAHPFRSNSSTDGLGEVIAFDATSGSPDTDYICTDLIVPQDYAGTGAAFVVRATKGAETGANTELINCAGSINGAALGTAGTVTTSGTASSAYTCAATLTALAAGDALGVTFRITSGGTADDAVNFQAVEFRYTATE